MVIIRINYAIFIGKNKVTMTKIKDGGNSDGNFPCVDSYHWTTRVVPALDVGCFHFIDMLILQCITECSFMSIVSFYFIKNAEFTYACICQYSKSDKLITVCLTAFYIYIFGKILK